MDYEDDKSDNSDFSNEDLGLLKKALHVDLPQNFNPNKAPQNGEEYLQHVMYEAKRCPDFVVAPINIKKMKPSMQVNVREECYKAPSSMLPTRKWQDERVENFTKFRKFLFKKLEMQQANRSTTNIKKLISSELPKFTIVAGLSQENKIKALETILEHMDRIKPGDSISRQKGIWIYSLLATLDTPLFPDTCYFLREFARKCSEIRSNLQENATEEQFVPLNLYICLISKFYRQLDLADDA